MLERFVKLEIATQSTFALLDRDLPTLTPEEWKIASHICQILKPFQSVNKTISGMKYCSAYQLIQLTSSLQNLLKKQFSNSVIEVVSELQAELNKRLGDIENSSALSICTFLHPRFKSIAFPSPSYSEPANNQDIYAYKAVWLTSLIQIQNI
ncbi:hypothetical protein PR048_023739 [Dryococelus australis]|uniref:Uncharacterized protein n=1 Tax=Dryococelus australis TaxID=614101 RepID=A0ABQ9GV11_9NEOP|nr:hypothetical protein PR048_023739 [Dryococelus australis]